LYIQKKPIPVVGGPKVPIRVGLKMTSKNLKCELGLFSHTCIQTEKSRPPKITPNKTGIREFKVIAENGARLGGERRKREFKGENSRGKGDSSHPSFRGSNPSSKINV